ncbi:unnamed protein product [Pleuronectes platessa]|uniref:Uncharacterized protein n=1 Tax=Pleuronectes platessa TaxID=8262 RepID=A0A9N7Z944_PLEPL|nr:unnamed protein product [Pleuronectes platessa]
MTSLLQLHAFRRCEEEEGVKVFLLFLLFLFFILLLSFLLLPSSLFLSSSSPFLSSPSSFPGLLHHKSGPPGGGGNNGTLLLPPLLPTQLHISSDTSDGSFMRAAGVRRKSFGTVGTGPALASTFLQLSVPRQDGEDGEDEPEQRLAAQARPLRPSPSLSPTLSSTAPPHLLWRRRRSGCSTCPLKEDEDCPLKEDENLSPEGGRGSDAVQFDSVVF